MQTLRCGFAGPQPSGSGLVVPVSSVDNTSCSFRSTATCSRSCSWKLTSRGGSLGLPSVAGCLPGTPRVFPAHVPFPLAYYPSKFFPRRQPYRVTAASAPSPLPAPALRLRCCQRWLRVIPERARPRGFAPSPSPSPPASVAGFRGPDTSLGLWFDRIWRPHCWCGPGPVWIPEGTSWLGSPTLRPSTSLTSTGAGGSPRGLGEPAEGCLLRSGRSRREGHTSCPRSGPQRSRPLLPEGWVGRGSAYLGWHCSEERCCPGDHAAGLRHPKVLLSSDFLHLESPVAAHCLAFPLAGALLPKPVSASLHRSGVSRSPFRVPRSRSSCAPVPARPSGCEGWCAAPATLRFRDVAGRDGGRPARAFPAASRQLFFAPPPRFRGSWAAWLGGTSRRKRGFPREADRALPEPDVLQPRLAEATSATTLSSRCPAAWHIRLGVSRSRTKLPVTPSVLPWPGTNPGADGASPACVMVVSLGVGSGRSIQFVLRLWMSARPVVFERQRTLRHRGASAPRRFATGLPTRVGMARKGSPAEYVASRSLRIGFRLTAPSSSWLAFNVAGGSPRGCEALW